MNKFIVIIILSLISSISYARNPWLGLDQIGQEVYQGPESTAPASGSWNVKIDPSSSIGISSGSSVINSDIRFNGYVSSGTSGKLSGVTSAIITINEKIVRWDFIIESTDTLHYAEITTDYSGGIVYINSNITRGRNVSNPKPITFYINNLLSGCTLHWDMETINK